MLATASLIFMRFRELMSAPGHALLQLLGPVQHNNERDFVGPLAHAVRLVSRAR
jgi:hypothetical protein